LECLGGLTHAKREGVGAGVLDGFHAEAAREKGREWGANHGIATWGRMKGAGSGDVVEVRFQWRCATVGRSRGRKRKVR
jgi:hypothetical protein